MTVWRQPDAPLAGRAPILFLDRDGVVVVDKNYLSDPAEVELVPGAAAAMRRARDAGFLSVSVDLIYGLPLQDLAGFRRTLETVVAARPDRLAELDLMQVIRQGKAAMVMANLAMAAYQQRLGEQLGIEPGAEMRAAAVAAKELELPLQLVDRDLATTDN